MRTVPLTLLVLAISCAGDNTGTTERAVTASESLRVLGGQEVAGQGDNPVVLEWVEDLTNFSRFAHTLIVRANREAHYRREGEDPVEGVFEISEAQWSAFSAELRIRRPCELESQAEGDHEEQRPRLTVAENGMHCQVALWDSEWASATAAARVRAHVHTLFPAE